MGKKILVVDDEKEYVELLKETLSERGYDITTAYDGLEAVEVIKKGRPDLIIMDVKMPKMNGYEVCALLSSDSQYKDIPVLLLTACGEMDAISTGMKSGAVSYIVKPFKQKMLLSLVNGLTGQQDLSDPD